MKLILARRRKAGFFWPRGLGLRALFPAKWLLPILLGISLAGCGSLWKHDDPSDQKKLAEVVDAIQYAIEQAAKSKAWGATEVEAKHWGESCKAASEAASVACVRMVDKAVPLCKLACPNGQCDPASQLQCQKYVMAEDFAGLCKDAPTGAKGDWCTSALICTNASKSRAQICANAETIVMPELLKADLSLTVEQTKNVSAGINILIVSFGGGRSEVASNVVSMTLKPRARDVKYASDVLPLVPEPKVVSEDAKALAAQLSDLITDAVAASVKEYGPGPGGVGAVPARAPVLLSDLQVTFSLVVEKNGKLGIKKAWEAPAGIEFGAESGFKRANSLTITYARPK